MKTNYSLGLNSLNLEAIKQTMQRIPKMPPKKTMYMHISTFEYIKSHPDVLNLKEQVMVGGKGSFDIAFNGMDIVINNKLKPTINEFPKGSWIFPKERFVIYEPSDEEWCRYFKIGYEARGFIMGEILGVDDDFFRSTSKPKGTAFTLERMIYN